MKSKLYQLRIIYLVSAIALAFLASCALPLESAPPSPIGITDQLGRVVRLEKPPQKIISLAPSNTEILFALGLADRVVAVTSYCDYPPEVKMKPTIGGFTTPDIEKVVALSPDLILATSTHEKTIIPQLERRGLTVFALAPKTLDQVLDAIKLVGEVTGKEEEASKLIADMQAKINAVTDMTNCLPQSQRPRVFYMTWQDPLMTVGSGNLDDELIRKAGGTNIAQNLTGTATITLEAVVEANPEVMIAGVDMGTGADAPFQFAVTEPRLKNTGARQNNRVYAIDMDIAGRSGPRIVDALEQLAGFIHPELFGDVK